MNHAASVLTLLFTTGCATLGSSASLKAQRNDSLSQSRAVREVYAPVVKRASRSVVEIAANGTRCILGTAVAPDLVVTKLSELQPRSPEAEPDAAAPTRTDRPPVELTCRQGENTWNCAQVGFDRAADLALLRVAGARLLPIEWQTEMPEPGAFLATPDCGEIPVGVGILGAAAYRHSAQRAFLGVRFVDPRLGPVVIDQAIAHGAAEAAGLRQGDVIVGFSKDAIADPQTLRDHLARHVPGDKVQVRVRREEAEMSFEVTLGTNTGVPISGQEELWGPLSAVRSGFREVLQHDAVIAPEDCGGPVVDLSGKAVGINIARAGRVETLALPAAAVQRFVRRHADRSR
ncbi:MAG: PDZ domain-containing protein [Planctomycetes bacterium]|nr:PDZ domain-containing protein [Planctomycetota bacterium]